MNEDDMFDDDMFDGDMLGRAPDEPLPSPQRYVTDLLGRRVPAVENTEPSRCYSASFGMVHIRPGCRCKGHR